MNVAQTKRGIKCEGTPLQTAQMLRMQFRQKIGK